MYNTYITYISYWYCTSAPRRALDANINFRSVGLTWFSLGVWVANNKVELEKRWMAPRLVGLKQAV